MPILQETKLIGKCLGKILYPRKIKYLYLFETTNLLSLICYELGQGVDKLENMVNNKITG